ncbi:MAG: hypothetical protein KKA35_03950, partial [Proteobacteria bacterium]|nr:hypothetical protein [Pseudomonadota bacterium]
MKKTIFFLQVVFIITLLPLLVQNAYCVETTQSSPTDFADAEPWGSVSQDGLPLGLYLNHQNFEEIRHWYSQGGGEADKFHFNKPRQHWQPIAKSMLNLDLNNTAYKHPPGLWHLSACAFAYALTGDKECGQAVRKMLLYLANMKSWTRNDLAAPEEESFIVTRVVICYDLVYTMLSKNDREKIAQAVENNGLQPLRKFIINQGNWTLNKAQYNGNQGYLQYSNQGAMYLGALYLSARLLYQHTGNEIYKNEYVKTARATQVLLQNYFPADGSVSAAPGYYLLTLDVLSDLIVPMAQSIDMRVDEFLPVGAHNPFLFALYLRSNASPAKNAAKYPLIVPFGDSSYTYLTYDPVKQAAVGANYLALAVWSGYISDPYLLWIYNQYAVTSDIESASSLVSHYYRSIINKNISPAKPLIPNEHLFETSGLLLWRDGFEQGDKMFALWKRGYQRGDHLHNTQNDILLEAFGERYLTNRGVNYARDKELGLSLSYNHNSITVDWKNNRDGATRKSIKPFLASQYLNYARSDASFNDDQEFIKKDPWKKEWIGAVSPDTPYAVRSVLYVKPDYYIVFDSILNKRPLSVQCNFVSGVPLNITEPWVTYNGKDSFLYQYTVISDKGAVFNKRETVDDKARKTWMLSIDTNKTVKDISFLNILFPVKAEEKRPLIDKLSNRTGTKIVVAHNKSKELIIQKNQLENIAVIGDTKTDGEIAILLYKDNQLLGAGLFGGTFLEVAGKK